MCGRQLEAGRASVQELQRNPWTTMNNTKKKRIKSDTEKGHCSQPQTSYNPSHDVARVYVCSICRLPFNSLRILNSHRQTHYNMVSQSHICPHCGIGFSSMDTLQQHVAAAHRGNPALVGKHVCHTCQKGFDRYHELIDHRVIHRTRPVDSRGFLWETDATVDPPWVIRDGAGNVSVDDKLRDLFVEKRDYMMDGHDEHGRVQGYYNYALNDFDGDISVLKRHLLEIIQKEQNAFKITLSFGLVLQHIETGVYTYYTAWLNNISAALFRIDRKEDIYDYLTILESSNMLERLMAYSDSTKLKIQYISNVTYIVFRTGYPIGAMAGVELPQYLADHKSILSLHKDVHGRSYTDRLCIFRCLAVKMAGGSTENLDMNVRVLYEQWRVHQIAEGVEDEVPEDRKKFKGIRMTQLPQFEECFKARIGIYALKIDKSCTKVYTSMLGPHDEVNVQLYLNLYESHFSLITEFKVYAQSYGCHFCGRAFPRSVYLKKHEKNCGSRVKYVFPGGVYKSTITIFQELERSLGLNIPKELQSYPYFAVYDFEALLKQVERPAGGEVESASGNTVWTTEHVPISVSVCSNVPGYEEPYAITDDDPDNLVKSMCDRLELIQIKAKNDMENRWEGVTAQLSAMAGKFPVGMLERIMIHLKSRPNPRGIVDCDSDASDGDSGDDSDVSDSDDDDDDDEGEKSSKHCDGGVESAVVAEEEEVPHMGSMEHQRAQERHVKYVERLTNRFNDYMSMLPVLGYNSSRYDLNLIKKRFPKHFNLVNDLKYVIKKTNQYTAIATSKFKFLDMSNYLAAGSSYSKFLAAYGVSETKGFFPYEWFQRVEQLDDTVLPPYEAFFSKLKNANVLDIDHTEWVRAGGEQQQQQQQQQHQLVVEPKTGAQNYAELQRIWVERGMQTFTEYLEYYVNLDTGPFVKAAQKMLTSYHEDGVDVFKIAVSAPGVARKLLFDKSNAKLMYFSSFGPTEADLYWKLKTCSIGGPSIIFKRHAKVGETYIRDNPNKTVQSIRGYDSNSLYLECLAREMPVLFPVRRRASRGFVPEVGWKYIEMYHWMEYVAKKEGITIQHKLRSGVEFPVGPYRLDGYSTDGVKRKGYEFHGCYFHGHDPLVCTGPASPNMSAKTKKLMETRRKHTQEREKFIRASGIELTVIYECEFAKLKKDIPAVNNVLDLFMPPFYLDNDKGSLSEDDIINSVKERDEYQQEVRRIRGIIQVDLEVPAVWPYELRADHPTMTPQEYFGEMAPIFCNSTVEYKDWGPTMREYSTQNGVNPLPRKLLVGGMKAEKLFLSTDLLRWYLSMGLKVTKVHEVIEYKFRECFADFREYISSRRREGDADPSKLILGETAKVLGNSSYGSLLLDKTKHTRVKYVHGQHDAHLAVNDPTFKTLTELPDELYEVEMSKNRTVLDIPIQLAFCILQNAKLEMLQFYYECLDYYVDRSDFEVTHMDTDSLYFSISGAELADVIKPEYKQKWHDELYVTGCREIGLRSERRGFLYWFPRECCATHRQYDKRVPGLFKLEASGTEVIALASKTYYLEKTDGSESVKAKGVQQRSISEAKTLYSDALFQQKTGYATNTGFRAKDSTIMTYTQKKKGFSFFYVKRVVQPDGVTTVAHETTMSPWTDYNTLILNTKNCLSNDFRFALYKHGLQFKTVTRLFLYEKAVENGSPADIVLAIYSAQNDSCLYRAASKITVKDCWFGKREGVMREIVELKISMDTHSIVQELWQSKGRRIVQPGHGSNAYFTCGHNISLAELMDPKSYPGHDFMSVFWEEKLHDEEFMGNPPENVHEAMMEVNY